MDDITTGVHETKAKEEIQVFPNPASNKLFININMGIYFRMQVFNVLGECVLQTELKNGLNEIEIGFLIQGFYLLTIETEKNKFKVKLIKD